MKKIRKAVIPAAGFGTRFLPQTKAMPKEMLPIVDKPIVQYIVEELVDAGIEDIIIVTGYHKRTIEDHFDRPSMELVENLRMGGEKKLKYLEEAASIDPIFKKKPDWTNININTPECLAKLDNNIGIISQKTDALNALVKKNN